MICGEACRRGEMIRKRYCSGDERQLTGENRSVSSNWDNQSLRLVTFASAQFALDFRKRIAEMWWIGSSSSCFPEQYGGGGLWNRDSERNLQADGEFQQGNFEAKLECAATDAKRRPAGGPAAFSSLDGDFAVGRSRGKVCSGLAGREPETAERLATTPPPEP